MNKDITIQEFIKLPLSTAIRYAVQDVKYFQQQGVTINMSDWWDAKEDKLCSVCLAGAVVCSFNELAAGQNLNLAQYARVLEIPQQEFNRILYTFDNLRTASISTAMYRWHDHVIIARMSGSDWKIIQDAGPQMAVCALSNPQAIATFLQRLEELADVLQMLGY